MKAWCWFFATFLSRETLCAILEKRKRLNMKFIHFSLLVSLIFSCASSSSVKFKKNIDREVLKIEKKLIEKKNEKSIDKTYPFWDYWIGKNNPIVLVTKNGNEIKKLSFEILEEEGYDHYNRKCQIYFKNNTPILITEIINAKCSEEVVGVDKISKDMKSVKIKTDISINDKIYIYNWDIFEIEVIGGNEYDYNLKRKQEYEKLITLIYGSKMKT